MNATEANVLTRPIHCRSAASSARPPCHHQSFIAAGTFIRCHTPPGLAHVPIQPANGRIRFPRVRPRPFYLTGVVKVPTLSTKSTASRPCSVSGGAASQRPPLHRALLDPTLSPKAHSAAALLRPRRPPAGEQHLQHVTPSLLFLLLALTFIQSSLPLHTTRGRRRHERRRGGRRPEGRSPAWPSSAAVSGGRREIGRSGPVFSGGWRRRGEIGSGSPGEPFFTWWTVG